MKTAFIALCLVLSFGASAEGNENGAALRALLAANPSVRNMSGRTVRVAEIIAANTLSRFNDDGTGSLAVSTLECRPRGRSAIQDCTLNILVQDVNNVDGSYVPAGNDSETGHMINFSLVEDRLFGAVTYTIAG